MRKEIEVLKQSKYYVQKQLFEDDAILKTMELMKSKLDLFQEKADTSEKEKIEIAEQLASTLNKMEKFEHMNQDLLSLNQKKDEIIAKM